MSYEYHYGVPANVVWAFHIVFALFLIYISYLYLENKPINKYFFIFLIAISFTAILYHSHLWYLNQKGYNNKDEKKNS